MSIIDQILHYESIIRLSAFLGSFLLLAIWEWFSPRRELIISRARRWIDNFALIVLSTVIIRLLIPTAAIGAAYLAEAKNWGILSDFISENWVRYIIAFVLLDLIIYFQHLSFHELPLLWRFHRVHHSDMDCDVSTGLRFHPIEMILSVCVKVSAIIILGAPVIVVIAFEVMLNMMSMFTHANIKLGTKIEPLIRLFIVTPDMHRIHHSVKENETNSNFGFLNPWWDRLFGTYTANPEGGHQNMVIGLDRFNNANSQKLANLLLMPFKSTILGYAINSRDMSNAEELVRANHNLEIMVQQAEDAKREAERANRAKSVFLANMSHELRTPLNAIIGYSEMIKDDASDSGFDSITTDVSKIRAAGLHLLSVINEVLDISKIEADKVELYLEEFNIDKLINEVVSTSIPLAENNGNKIIIENDTQLGNIRSDITKTRQILLNLISNAAKFTKKGTISIKREICVRNQQPAVKISIRDTGIGIQEDKLQQIFEPFSQADGSTTREYGGTGLGLTITRRYCEMLGGAIDVQSNAGSGTTFTIWLKAHMKDRASRQK